MGYEYEKFREQYEQVCEKFEKKTGIKEGAHVRYDGIKDRMNILKGLLYHSSDPRGILDIGSIYEIECAIIARTYSLIKLVGFRKEKFNPLFFEVLNKDEIKKCLKVGSQVRYIGDTYGGLNYEAIYEVESIKKNAIWLGFDEVKLVGFEDLFDREYFEKI